ncbi:hypothetical protein [Mariniblastus fucicola]|uniref:SMP-30/Gluconolaconase/LRE-like region n=1 Tax=Mariniblastus fucicola TaxID=980251 RepID=A0A5B9PFK3_9BACT|nr:hypothetical protein [Mariniblastus fucicola]QEG21663.1 hypothetical protein MFFC18_15210 [Mariniblastus fucicola]
MRIVTLILLSCCLLPRAGFGQTIRLALGGAIATQAPSSSGASILTAAAAADENAKDDESPKRKPGEIVVTTLVEGLNNPFSVTVEDDSNRIFVAESGAQRIVEIKDGKSVEIAGEFPVSEFRGYAAGPLSVFSAGENVLLVGHDNESGVGSLTRLSLALNSDDPASADAARATVSIEHKTDEAKLNQFSNMTLKHSVIYTVTNGDPANGWIALAELQSGTITTLRPSIATAKLSSCPGPTCVTVSPAGEYLVASQMGKRGDAKDSRLVFYTLQGKMLRNFKVELNDIVALAYSPDRKHLFAIDYNFADPSKGGLYKLIGNGADKCEIKKLQHLSYATSMSFDRKGNLYVTCLGGPPERIGAAGNESSDEAKDAPVDAARGLTKKVAKGTLIKIEGLDDRPAEPDETVEGAEGEDVSE